MGFSTDDIPSGERHDAYRALVDVALDSREPTPDFAAEIENFQLDRMVLQRARAGGQTSERTAERIRSDDLSLVVLQLNLEGELRGDYDGRSVLAGPGEIVVADFARPLRKRSTAESTLRVMLARELVEAVAPSGFDLHGLVLDVERGGLLADHVRALAARLPALPASAASHVTRATAELLGACLAPSAQSLARARRAVEAVAFDRARRFIEANLRSRELSAAVVASAVCVSRSVLYRMFEPFGGVCQYIWRRRLARVHAVLAGPSAHGRIFDVACEWGFTSEAHFSRSFRRQYGISPSELRNLRGAPPGPERSADVIACHEWVLALG